MLSIAIENPDHERSIRTPNDQACENEVESRADLNLNFLPKPLTTQCLNLIESYHALHGYSCLPDVLWKSGLKHFIETHDECRQLLRIASTTRSAKKSNENFMAISKMILALEILASNFSGWSTIYPQAGMKAHARLVGNKQSARMPLMDFYLYPPKHVTSAAIAALLPPVIRQFDDADQGIATAAKQSDGSRSDYAMASQTPPS